MTDSISIGCRIKLIDKNNVLERPMNHMLKAYLRFNDAVSQHHRVFTAQNCHGVVSRKFIACTGRLTCNYLDHILLISFDMYFLDLFGILIYLNMFCILFQSISEHSCLQRIRKDSS